MSKTMRAIVQTAPGVSSVQNVPIPKIEYGSVLVKIEVALLHANFSNIYHQRQPMFRLPYPIIPGSNAIGRIIATGPDATSLKEGQLVMVSTFVTARDDPSISIVWGVTQGPTPDFNRLYQSLARNGVYAEYVLAPMETVFRLNEQRFLGNPSSGGLGLVVPDLLQLASDTILYAGLRSVNLQAGERIIITPATGHYSAAAVDVALAMGAQVIAASRSLDKLKILQAMHPSVHIVQLTGNADQDKSALTAFGEVDVVADVSPPSASGSNNLEVALSVIKVKGRVAILGGRVDQTIPISYLDLMLKSITIQGKYMFDDSHQREILKLAEAGILKLGANSRHEIVASYGLDDLESAIAKAVETSAPGQSVIIVP